MKAIVVAGGLPQITLISQLKERGIKVVLLDGNENAIARPYSDIFYKVNIFDVEALMKEIFKKNNIPTSEFVVMKELDLSQIQGLHYPLIVKPVDAYSSKGVRKVDNEQELKDSFEIAAQISRNKNVIIEEYFEGEEISVDLFVLNGKAHVLCVSNSEKVKAHDRFVIFRGKFPVHVSEKLMKKIENVSQKIAESFQIRNAPMLVQMLTNGENITVLEFCARTGGAM